MTSFFESIMQAIYSWVGNYGVAVAIFTVLVRLVVLPLDYKSRQSMRAMSRVQPKMQELQKKYADDKEKLNKKMSELYKREHVNPLMGCLPMIIQLVLMIFMFTAMRNLMFKEMGTMMHGLFAELIEKGAEGVDKLQPQGFLWIRNIFQPDSVGSAILPSYSSAISMIKQAGIEFTAPENLESIYNTYLNMHYGVSQFMSIKVLIFTVTVPTTLNALRYFCNGYLILPIFACLSQVFMTKIQNVQNPQPETQPNGQPNPMNGAMMKWFFPLFSFYICMTQNAGFSVYWATANIIAIIQTFVINKVLENQEKKRAPLSADTTDLTE